MMSGKFLKQLIPVFLVFILFHLLATILKNRLMLHGINNIIVMKANLLLLVLSVLTFSLHHKALHHSNPNVFVRSVMGGMMIKMFVCAAAVLMYVLLNKESYSKNSLLLSMVLYLVYLGTEVFILTKLARKK